jgi:hypothetical protein
MSLFSWFHIFLYLTLFYFIRTTLQLFWYFFLLPISNIKSPLYHLRKQICNLLSFLVRVYPVNHLYICWRLQVTVQSLGVPLLLLAINFLHLLYPQIMFYFHYKLIKDIWLDIYHLFERFCVLISSVKSFI